MFDLSNFSMYYGMTSGYVSASRFHFLCAQIPYVSILLSPILGGMEGERGRVVQKNKTKNI